MITLIDTPGHIDFSCETERALSVQDYAVLVISARDGVTAHTKTLWHLLAARGVPTFIFVNKLDISERRRGDLLSELSAVLSPRVVDFSKDTTPEFYEAAAAQDERLIAEFFETESLSTESIRRAIAGRKIFPCFFGSAFFGSTFLTSGFFSTGFSSKSSIAFVKETTKASTSSCVASCFCLLFSSIVLVFVAS